MLSRKLALLLVVGVVQVESKEAGTVIAQFWLADQVLPASSKWFANNTNYKIKFRWTVTDRETREFCAQEPVVDKKGSVEIGLELVADYFGSHGGALGYDVTIEVFKVLKTPRQKWDEMDACPFKNGRKDLMISSATFLENDDFELLIHKSGILDCKPISRRKELSRKQR